jgi:hypothetical protein
MTCSLRLLVSLSILPACIEDADPSSTADGSTSSVSGSSTAVSPAFDCVEQNFAPSPLAGPGLDPETGAIVGSPQASYVLHTTQAVLDPELTDAFNAAAGEVLVQAQAAEGLVALSLAMDQECGYARTLGIWESEEAMLTFVATGAHAQAMSDAPSLIANGRFTHFDITPEDIDRAWELALERITTVAPAYE